MWIGTFYGSMKFIFIWIALWIRTIAASRVENKLIRFFKSRWNFRKLWYDKDLFQNLCSVHFFFEGLTPRCLVAYSANIEHRNIAPPQQAHQWVVRTIFMQDRALLHIFTCVKNVHWRFCHQSPFSPHLACKISIPESLWIFSLELLRIVCLSW